MTPSNILDSGGLQALALQVAPDTLFAFDLDGTLAPIVEEYSAAKIDKPVRAALGRLNNLARVAVITGRSRKDAQVILGFEPQLLVGNHGSEWPDQEPTSNRDKLKLCQKWQGQLHEMLGYRQGIETEFKGESLSLHYRKAEDQELVLSQINIAIEHLSPMPKIIGGKFVVNLLPPDAITKGDALLIAMNMFKLNRAIFIGDDVTDEEVFKLKDVDVFGIHIGEDKQTSAPYYLEKQSAILGLLKSIVEILETRIESGNQA